MGGCVNLSFLLGTRTPRVLPPVTLRVPVRAQHAERMEAVRRAHAMRDLIAS